MKLLQILKIFILFLNFTYGRQIKTLINKNKNYTTGNWLKLNYNNIINNKKYKKVKIKYDHLLKEKIINYKNKIDFQILDIFSEDSKSFTPQINHFWFIITRRGNIFSFISVIVLFFFLIIYSCRIFYGIFGGYKTRLIPPSGFIKNVNHLLILIIFTLTLFFFMITFKQGRLIYDEITNIKNLANSSNNEIKNWIYDSIKNIKKINKSNIKVLYSDLSYETFNINEKLYLLKNTFKIYYKSNKEFIDYFFGVKIYHILSEMMFNYILIIITVLIFYYAYFKRIINLSLLLSFITLLNLIIYFNSYYSIFNYQSVLTNICFKSVELSNYKHYHVNPELNTIVNGFNKSEKEIVKKQLYILLISKQSIFIILKKLINSNISLALNENFENIYQLKNENYIKKLKSFKNKDLNNYIDLGLKVINLFENLEKLDNSTIMLNFFNQYNDKICRKTLNYVFNFYYRYLYLGVILLWLWLSFFYSENIIKFIHLNESNYVKTKILRYDWN